MKKIILFSIVSLSTLFASAQCSADFTWSVSGSTVQLTNTSTGTNVNNWSFGDGGNSSATNPSYTYTSSGSYDICLYSFYIDSMGGFCSDSVCHLVTVFQDSTGGTGCSTSASIYSNGNEIIGINTSIGASQYYWTVSDYTTGAPLTSASTTDLSYFPNNNGSFWVCLTASDSMGNACDTTICNVVTINDSLDSTASTASLTLNQFKLYPNPTNAVLNLQIDQLPNNSHARIVDLVGREMIRAELTGYVTEIQVTNIPSGIYLVQLVDSNDQIIRMKKFIRE